MVNLSGKSRIGGEYEKTSELPEDTTRFQGSNPNHLFCSNPNEAHLERRPWCSS